MDPKAFKSLAMKDLHMSENSFYYYNRKREQQHLTLEELLTHYDLLNYHISTDPFERNFESLPELLMIISPLMMRNYELYGAGQFCAFDLTFHLIRDRHANGRTFKVGCFIGLSNTRRLVPFALVITT